MDCIVNEVGLWCRIIAYTERSDTVLAYHAASSQCYMFVNDIHSRPENDGQFDINNYSLGKSCHGSNIMKPAVSVNVTESVRDVI